MTLSSRILDGVQLALDIGGLVPVVGEACDATNVLIHVARGNKAEALISLAALIPVAGAAVVSGKFATKAGKALANNADKLDEIAEAASNVAQAARRNPQQDAANIRRINNVIRDHLKPKDIAGTLKESLGIKLINPDTGKEWQHIKEMTDTLNCLRRRAAELSGATDAAAVAARQKALDAIRQIESAFQGLGI